MFCCKLWKITLSSLYPSGSTAENIFWAYHMDEKRGRTAALRWVADKNGGQSIDSILLVEQKT